MRILLLAGVLLIGFVAAFGLVEHHRSAGTNMSQSNPQPRTTGSKRAVLVELFTSEGCSSCPPADLLLTRLQDGQPIAGAEIITLSEHVDYWNHLGWKDPYSNSQFSARQQRYAEALGVEDIYTPQMVVDGQKGFVGSNETEARRAIAAEAELPSAHVTLSLDSASSRTNPNEIALRVRVDNLAAKNGRPLEVVLAIAESGLRSSVKSGENSGRTLLHTSVVRKLTSIGTMNPKDGPSFQAQPVIHTVSSWRRDRLRAVVFVQDKSSMQVLGAASVNLPET